jgi:hypothetical protein
VVVEDSTKRKKIEGRCEEEGKDVDKLQMLHTSTAQGEENTRAIE